MEAARVSRFQAVSTLHGSKNASRLCKRIVEKQEEPKTGREMAGQPPEAGWVRKLGTILGQEPGWREREAGEP